MAQEIERKFLVVNDTWRSQVSRSAHYRQGYLNDLDQGGKCSIRVRTSDGHAYLNIKGATLGIARQEFEFAIPERDADSILNQFALGACIDKTRHFVEFGGHTWEIDVFEGDNAGLVVAEIELQSVDEKFVRPPWLGAEVSNDPRYYNVCLVKHPYRKWVT